MLQPQGLFSAPRPFEPQPWPGSGGSASLFAPPLPGDAGPREGPSQTLPHGMQPVPPGDPYQPAGPYPPGGPYAGGRTRQGLIRLGDPVARTRPARRRTGSGAHGRGCRAAG